VKYSVGGSNSEYSLENISLFFAVERCVLIFTFFFPVMDRCHKKFNSFLNFRAPLIFISLAKKKTKFFKKCGQGISKRFFLLVRDKWRSIKNNRKCRPDLGRRKNNFFFFAKLNFILASSKIKKKKMDFVSVWLSYPVRFYSNRKWSNSFLFIFSY
jgi:hypothetical protein